MATAKNVLGTQLKPCSMQPLTGYYRNGCCDTGENDMGVHVVCAEMNDHFLAYSKSQGNDLSTPIPEYGFPGLKAGDKWCVCVSRWKDAMLDGVIAPVDLEATHISTLEFVDLEDLQKFALEQPS